VLDLIRSNIPVRYWNKEGLLLSAARLVLANEVSLDLEMVTYPICHVHYHKSYLQGRELESGFLQGSNNWNDNTACLRLAQTDRYSQYSSSLVDGVRWRGVKVCMQEPSAFSTTVF
jgi:hypothetical protein